MTREQVEEIKRRAEEATPGPWERSDGHSQTSWFEFGPLNDFKRVDRVGDARGSYTAEFIAHAREDVPALIAALEEAWAKVDRLFSRGIDLRHENEELRVEVERLKVERDHFKREMLGRAVANVLEWTK